MRVGTRGWKWWVIAVGWALIMLVAVGYDAQLVSTPLTTVLGSFTLSGHLTTYTIGGDFTMYYAAANALRLNPHANIYSLATIRAAYGGGCGQPPTTTYPYQPLLALLLEPVTLLSCSTALYAWWQLSFLLWGIVTYWFARDATKAYGPGRGLLVGVICLSFRPIWDGLEHGQLHILVLFVFVLASRLIARHWPQCAGGALALGVALKYFPAVVIVYYLARGRWRVALGAAVTGFALLAAELLIVGPTTLLGSIHGATADVATYSALHRNWLSNIPAGVILARLMLVVTFAVIVALAWRRRPSSDALGEGWVLCAALLVAPLAWYHYLTWLLPLVIALFHAALDGTRAIRPGFSVGAITRRLPLVGFGAGLGMLLVPGAGEMLVGWALVVLWFLCGALYLVSARRENNPTSQEAPLAGRVPQGVPAANS